MLELTWPLLGVLWHFLTSKAVLPEDATVLIGQDSQFCFVTWRSWNFLKYFVSRSMSSVSVCPILVFSSILSLVKWLFVILIIKIGGMIIKQGTKNKRLFSKTIDLLLSIDMQMYISLWKVRTSYKTFHIFSGGKDFSSTHYENWHFMWCPTHFSEVILSWHV